MAIETQKTLIHRIRDTGDASAWNEFFELYHPLLLNFFVSRGLDHNDADDVGQAVLQRIAKAAPDFEYDPKKGKFRAWLFRIARNELNRFFAKTARNRESTTLDGEVPTNADQVDPELEAAWTREYRQHIFAWACRQVKPTVSEKSWQAFWKTAIDGETAEATAAALDLKLGSVYVAKSRIIKRLRDCVAGISGEDHDAPI